METKAILSGLVRVEELRKEKRRMRRDERKKGGEVCLARKSSTLISLD
jgi:hypothetical protein